MMKRTRQILFIVSLGLTQVGPFAFAEPLSYSAFGKISELKDLNEPIKNLAENGAVLLVSRVQKISSSKSCKEVFAAFKGLEGGKAWSEKDKKTFHAWEPYSEKDRAAVTECDDFPCAVKLDAKEVAKMKAAASSERMDQFFDLVQARAKNYLEKGERKEYEFAGDPSDPFKVIGAGLKGDGADLIGKSSKILARIIDMKDSRARPVRQLVDERYAEGKSDGSDLAVFFSRDVYTAHYFDSWGEYKALLCKGSDLRLLQVYLLELDLLKKTDFVSMISRESMKKNVREGADRMMDQFVTALEKKIK